MSRFIVARTKIQIEDLIPNVTLNGKRGKLSRRPDVGDRRMVFLKVR